MGVRSVLFVCAGNICRSPIAEALFRKTIATRPALATLEVGSAGTIALDGNRATPEAVAAARECGVDITAHRARAVDGLDADLVLTMDRRVTRDVARLGLAGTVVLLGEFAASGEVVEDPYGCPLDEYRTCARQLERLIEGLADRLESLPASPDA